LTIAELTADELTTDELATDELATDELTALEMLDETIEDATMLLEELTVELARLELLVGVELLLEPPPQAVRLVIKAQ
jgi:hypothetical protein